MDCAAPGGRGVSLRAYKSVIDADIRPAPLKFVATVLAWHANDETGQLNPSLARVAAQCGFESKDQARRHINALVAMGVLKILADTPGLGRRYALATNVLASLPRIAHAGLDRADRLEEVASAPPVAPMQPVAQAQAVAAMQPVAPVPATGCTGATGEVASTPLTGGMDATRKTRKTVKNTQRLEAVLADFGEFVGDVDRQVLADWVAHRAAKRAVITKTVFKERLAEAKDAGISLERAMAIEVASNWQGFRAAWVTTGERAKSSPRTDAGAAHNFRDKSYTTGIDKHGRVLV